MSKEFDDLKKQASQDTATEKARHKERYQYARGLGFSTAMARRLVSSSKERILRLSKEL